MQEYFLLAIALVLGIFIGWLMSKLLQQRQQQTDQQALAQLQAEKASFDNTVQTLQKERDSYLSQAQHAQGKIELLAPAQQELASLQQAHQQLREQYVLLQEKQATALQTIADKKRELEEVSASLRLQFQQMAGEILTSNTQQFAASTDERMKAILEPLKNEMANFKQKVEETYDKESKERFSLSAEVKRLVETTQQIGQEANNLTTALKGNKKQQGNWGEMLLESILEHSGLTKGREYETQAFIRDNAGNIIKDEYGHGLQPDVMIHYPDHRTIIIDSKVSLNAWLAYTAADTADEQAAAWQQHVQALRQHVQGLSRKNYPKYAQALDYVLMFVPNEAAFLEVMKTEQQLWKEAYDKKILMVSPTNLLAVLKIIADLWRIEQQSQHAIAIAEKAGDLYDKFVGFTESLQEVGKKIQDAQQAHDNAFKQLYTGRGNLVRRVEELKKMGASAKKQLGEGLLKEEEE